MTRPVFDLLERRHATVQQLFCSFDKNERDRLRAHILYLDRLLEDLESDEGDWENQVTAVQQ